MQREFALAQGLSRGAVGRRFVGKHDAHACISRRIAPNGRGFAPGRGDVASYGTDHSFDRDASDATTGRDSDTGGVTGYIDRLMDARPLWEGEAFLEKPFSVAGLREAVSLLLHGTVRR
jgi:hypothetical protein